MTDNGDVPSALAPYGERTIRAVNDFREFAAQAQRLVGRGRRAYDEDEMLRLASDALVVKLGEAVARMGEEFLADHPELPLRLIKDMRNLVAHEYDAIRPQLVWNALERELPKVDAALARLLDST